ncbi:1100_t:CDS:2 [Diversispora eburnea]|uniref:1100_t:CDS:1 n=1 Tax=Diversispora eburnea TaxID=1213867 RepID=A0A9N9GPG5_9GLOM|nr:1100_t:CDS:2 [Diversispora eburnea]
MPPKKTQSEKSKQKDKQKIVEDKTFGLKNKKKSVKVQQQIKQIENQVFQAGNRKAQKEKEIEKQALANKKLAEQKKKEEHSELFKPVQTTQKVPFGVDPKTILCQFFKAGQCLKGDKCKFSHDSNVERKSSKIDIYTDSRQDEERKNDTMDKWDQEKLEQVVTSKNENPKTTTDIVCKYFLEAIENQKYGWFWECPNGGKLCKYRHALPPGFILKKSQKKAEEEENQITLEEFLETERHKLGTNLTPITLESFTKWKKNRKAKIEADEELKRASKEAAFKAGKAQGMSGRDLFTFNPDLVNQAEEYDDDGDVFDLSGYKQNNVQEITAEGIEVKADLFAEENLDDLDDLDDDEQ